MAVELEVVADPEPMDEALQIKMEYAAALEKCKMLEAKMAEANKQIVLLNGQLQAAISQRNAFANDSVLMAGELYALKQ